VDSDNRTVSRRDALKIALGGAAMIAATTTVPRARADGLQLLDFAEHLVPPEQIKAAGYAGVIVYVSASRPGANFDFKPVTRQYADGLRANGLQIVSVYQYGKPGWPTPSDYTRGYDGGVADAQTALQLHGAAGGTVSAPIFFSVDEDIDRATWDGPAVAWFRGINSVLGAPRTGIYGHANACAWAIADGVIGYSTTPGFRWAWQTRAWSQGVREPAAVLYQNVIVTPNDPGVVLGGVHVDVDDVLAPDYGQWDLTR
jgi:hypothetical protein